MNDFAARGDTTMPSIRRLTLNRETLRRLGAPKVSDVTIAGDDSCAQSCYLVSCGDPEACTISRGRGTN